MDKFDTRVSYMKALQKQLLFELQRFKATPHSIESVFIGGGTPSTVSPALYAPIFELLQPYLASNSEITTEANPNSASFEWLKGMKKLGVNRVSFGVQSFNEEKLKKLNRSHTPQHAKDAIKNAHSIGFKNISLDIIYNYKGDTEALLQNDLEIAFSLPINHISAYELTIEENTLFASTPQVKQENEKLAFFVTNTIEKKGFNSYEISNFGTYQSVHNKGYWELKNYMGVGAGAVGFLKNKRFYPQTDIEAYIANPLTIKEEPLSQEELLTEQIFLGLRSIIGVKKSLLKVSMLKNASFLVQEGKLEEDERHFYNKNFFLSDELALFVLG